MAYGIGIKIHGGFIPGLVEETRREKTYFSAIKKLVPLVISKRR